MTIDTVAFTQALIKRPSITPKEEGVLDLLEETLSALGFACQRQTFHQAGTDSVDNLYARFGTASPNFCFAGHTDVVPVGDEKAWSYPPFGAEIHNGVLYGRGAEDMKGAIAAFTAAVSRYLEKHKKTLKGSISLLITMDEEGVGINGLRKMLKWLAERGEKLDSCLVGEPTNPKRIGDMVKIGRRGSMRFVLTVFGKQGHVAYPQNADNPITRLVEMVHRLKNTKLDDGTEFFIPSNLEVTSIDVGNAAANVIPAQAQAKLNIRFNNLHTSAQMIEWVKRICDKVGGKYELSHHINGEPFIFPPGPLAHTVAGAVKEVTGLTPEFSTTGGTSDARYIKDYCPVVEFGATGYTPHMVNECVKVADLELLSAVYERVLEKYFA